MPKATLTWDLDEPDDAENFNVLNKAYDFRGALEDIATYLRAITDLGKDGAEEIREEFYSILRDRNIDGREF